MNRTPVQNCVDGRCWGASGTTTDGPGDQGYPIRGIVRNGWLYLCNLKPWLLPGGNPETGYRDIDSSPTKTAILQLSRSGQDSRYYDLSMGPRRRRSCTMSKRIVNAS